MDLPLQSERTGIFLRLYHHYHIVFSGGENRGVIESHFKLLSLPGRENRGEKRSSHKPKVVPSTQDDVVLEIQRRADLSETAVAAPALQTVLVPHFIQSAEQIPIFDGALTTGASRSGLQEERRWNVEIIEVVVYVVAV